MLGAGFYFAGARCIVPLHWNSGLGRWIFDINKLFIFRINFLVKNKKVGNSPLEREPKRAIYTLRVERKVTGPVRFGQRNCRFGIYWLMAGLSFPLGQAFFCFSAMGVSAEFL